MILLWLYIAFSYGWCARSIMEGKDKIEWVFWLGSPIFFPVGIYVYLQEKYLK